MSICLSILPHVCLSSLLTIMKFSQIGGLTHWAPLLLTLRVQEVQIWNLCFSWLRQEGFADLGSSQTWHLIHSFEKCTRIKCVYLEPKQLLKRLYLGKNSQGIWVHITEYQIYLEEKAFQAKRIFHHTNENQNKKQKRERSIGCFFSQLRKSSPVKGHQ